ELSAVAAYRRLADMHQHPALSPLLRRIGQQETRHVAFYTTQARARLEASTRAQGLLRIILEKVWKPVGSGIMSESEVKHVMGHLLAGHGEELDKLGKRMQKLPGLDGSAMFRTAFTRLGIV